MLKTALYIDGFNLYYSAVKGTPLRWLNPVSVLNPQRISGPGAPTQPRPNAGLQRATSFYQDSVTWAQLEAAQFPDTLSDAQGTFQKPADWR